MNEYKRKHLITVMFISWQRELPVFTSEFHESGQNVVFPAGILNARYRIHIMYITYIHIAYIEMHMSKLTKGNCKT